MISITALGRAALQRQDEAATAPHAAEHDLVPRWEGQFNTFIDWVNRAQKALTVRRERAVCVDAKGRRCSSGADFMRARDEGTFPVRYFWECQPAAATQPGDAGAEQSAHGPDQAAGHEEAPTGGEASQGGIDLVREALAAAGVVAPSDAPAAIAETVRAHAAAQREELGLLRLTCEQLQERLKAADAHIERLETAALQQRQGGPVAYCKACQSAGMLNCGNFDECGGAQCVTCHQKLPLPAAAAASPQADGPRGEN